MQVESTNIIPFLTLITKDSKNIYKNLNVDINRSTPRLSSKNAYKIMHI